MELARRERDRRAQLGRKAKPRPRHPDGRVWTPERAALADVADLLLEVRALLQAQVSQRNPRRPKPMPRPRTAFDRLESADAYQRHLDRVAKLLPHKRRE